MNNTGLKFVASNCCRVILSAALFLASSQVSAASKGGGYYLIAGPSFSSGKVTGLGGLVGLIDMPPTDDIDLFHSFIAGGFSRGKGAVLHADALAGVTIKQFLNFFVGPGFRSAESRPPYLQLTYGITVGPSTFALRNFFGASGLQTEGFITLTVPLQRFSER